MNSVYSLAFTSCIILLISISLLYSFKIILGTKRSKQLCVIERVERISYTSPVSFTCGSTAKSNLETNIFETPSGMKKLCPSNDFPRLLLSFCHIWGFHTSNIINMANMSLQGNTRILLKSCWIVLGHKMSYCCWQLKYGHSEGTLFRM